MKPSIVGSLNTSCGRVARFRLSL